MIGRETQEPAPKTAGHDYRSFADFYRRSGYRRFPQLHAGSLRTQLTGFLVDQGAHDFTDAPVPDFVLGLPLAMSCPASFNLGEGWHRARRRRGDLMLVPPGVEVAYRVDGPCRLLVLTWPAGSVRALDPERYDEEPRLFEGLYGRFFRADFILEFAQRAFRALNSCDAPSRLLLDGALTTLIALLAQHGHSRSARNPPSLSISPARLQRAIDYIETHLDRDLALAEIAAAAGLSSFHFSRVFKAATGHSPYRYVTERRVERARSALEATTVPIAQIAADVGFSSQSRLTTAFRLITGTTPGVWRRRCRT